MCKECVICTYSASGTSLVDEIPPTPFSQWILPKARRVRTVVHSIEQFRTINASGFTVYILASIKFRLKKFRAISITVSADEVKKTAVRRNGICLKKVHL